MEVGRPKNPRKLLIFSSSPLMVLVIVVLAFVVSGAEGLWCDRTPQGVTNSKSPGDSGFKIVISGDPDRYIPGAVYSVRIQGSGDMYADEKFSGFLLLAESLDGQSPDVSGGNFQLTEDSLARFSEFCPHAVKQASELSKSEVQVMWNAPQPGAGCVTFKATVIKNKIQWYMDEGGLTKQFCPETEDGVDPNEENEPCCACDEAKYELSFEGQWSGLTHPKDYPADTWSAHFSDIIGASHSPNFRFWENSGVASEGIRHLAEQGDSRDLESELKDQSGSIRTIIKARGLKHPNFFGHKTFAVFRTDNEHNLISLVSKIAPSPDWFVGITGLNLCLRNCSWVEIKEISLFPWDSGTDNGNTYLAARETTIPRGNIHRIVLNIDKNSPFYDPNGNMKPFAKLRLQKLRSYERACDGLRESGLGQADDEDDEDDEVDDQDRPECAVRPWSPWSGCSATCGKGVQKRFRQYVYESKARELGCNRRLVSQQNCYAPTTCKEGSYGSSSHRTNTNLNKFGGGSRDTSPRYNPYDRNAGSSYGNTDSRGYGGGSRPDSREICAVTDWSAWSTCSVTCAQGVRFRTRRFQNSVAERYNCDVKLREADVCYGQYRDCNDISLGNVEPGCETTQWSEWGACSTTCGKGIQTRTRMYKDSTIDHRKCNLELMQSQTCDGIKTECSTPEDMKDICMLTREPGKCSDHFSRWYFNSVTLSCMKFIYTGCKGNKNNFPTEEDCEESCGIFKEIQIEPQPPSSSYGGSGGVNRHHHGQGNSYYNQHHQNSMSPYSTTNSRDRHHREREHSRNRDVGYGPYGSSSSYQQTYNPTSYNDGPSIDCVVSDFSSWSPCSVTCGRGHKYRTRYIKVFNQNGGEPCPRLEQRRKCKGTQCPPNHPYRFQQDFYDFRE